MNEPNYSVFCGNMSRVYTKQMNTENAPIEYERQTRVGVKTKTQNSPRKTLRYFPLHAPNVTH